MRPSPGAPAMTAGELLDAEVAVSVMGYTRPGVWKGEALDCVVHPDGHLAGWYRKDGSFCWHIWEKGSNFSTDIADAWKVVEKLRDMWTEATAAWPADGTHLLRPFDDAEFFEMLQRSADRRWPWAFLYVTPAAICRAALAAVSR